MNKFLGHLSTVFKHKTYVFYYCCKLGIPWRGFIHDLSKFSPVEFWESVKYYSGDRSPIDNCKDDKGYSKAWFHHRGHNKHHWEFWVDNYEKGIVPVKMPRKYVIEMIADYLGAGRAYHGKNFTYMQEYEWWKNKRTRVQPYMHPDVYKIVDTIFEYLAAYTEPDFYMIKTYIKSFYR